MEKIILIAAIILANGLASAAISFTITWSGIFKGFREWVASKSKFLEELIFCPWCTNFYILVFISMIELIEWYKWVLPMDTFSYFFYLCYALFISWTIAGLCHYVLLRAYEPVKDYMLEREIEMKTRD